MSQETNKKQQEHYRSIIEQRIQHGRDLGFTADQLRFIVETASLMGQVMAMSPPVDENGKPVQIKGNW